jgi:hypothetical protein
MLLTFFDLFFFPFFWIISKEKIKEKIKKEGTWKAFTSCVLSLESLLHWQGKKKGKKGKNMKGKREISENNCNQ